MRVRIVVADEAEARFFETESAGAALELVGHLSDPGARLHDRDLKSDRPGRVFDHAAGLGGRRGAVAHHATGGERRPRRIGVQRFARRIARDLQSAQQQARFDRLVLMAGPPFLGALRAALPQALLRSVVAEVPKDLVHQSDGIVREHLSREVFRSGGGEAAL